MSEADTLRKTYLRISDIAEDNEMKSREADEHGYEALYRTEEKLSALGFVSHGVENTGGGCMVLWIEITPQCFVGINDESSCLYRFSEPTSDPLEVMGNDSEGYEIIESQNFDV